MNCNLNENNIGSILRWSYIECYNNKTLRVISLKLSDHEVYHAHASEIIKAKGVTNWHSIECEHDDE